MEVFLEVIGLVLVGFYFVFFVFWNFHFRIPSIDVIKNAHVPFPRLVFGVGLIIEGLCGLLIIFEAILLAFFPGSLFLSPYLLIVPAGVLMIFILSATFLFHRFWELEPGMVRLLNTIIFIGNFTISLSAVCFVMMIGLSWI